MKSAFVFLAVALLLAQVSPAFAISEEGFEAPYAAQVRPFFESGRDGFFPGQANAQIHFKAFVNPAATSAIVISNGFRENAAEYAELTYDLYQRGYSVFLFDHRGQGASTRLTNDTHLAYIDNFDYFVADLKTFVETIVKPGASGQSLYLIGHSMGGGIAARYLETYAGDFKAVALSAPMLGFPLQGWNPKVALAMLETLHYTGQGQSVAMGYQAADPRLSLFAENSLTHSHSRYQAFMDASGRDTLGVLFAPANDWVWRAMKGAALTLANAAAAKDPVLLLQAEKERVVYNPPEDAFCSAAAACTEQKILGARHEILMEQDAIRAPAIESILDFFRTHQ